MHGVSTVRHEVPDAGIASPRRSRPPGLLPGRGCRAAQLVPRGRHLDGLVSVSNGAEEWHQGRGAPRHARSAVCAHVSEATGDRLLPVVAARVVVDYCRGQHWTEARARAVIRQLLDLCVTTKPPEPEPQTRGATVLYCGPQGGPATAARAVRRRSWVPAPQY